MSVTREGESNQFLHGTEEEDKTGGADTDFKNSIYIKSYLNYYRSSFTQLLVQSKCLKPAKQAQSESKSILEAAPSAQQLFTEPSEHAFRQPSGLERGLFSCREQGYQVSNGHWL